MSDLNNDSPQSATSTGDAEFYLLNCVCYIHGTNFNTRDHLPGRLKRCSHEVCNVQFQNVFQSAGGYKCHFCTKFYYDQKDITIDTNWLILAPLYCERHPDSHIESFCKFHKSLHCSNCEQPERGLCVCVNVTESNFNIELSTAIQVMEQEYYWPNEIRQRCYDSLRTNSVSQKLQLLKDMNRVGPRHLHRKEYGLQFLRNKHLICVEGTPIPPPTLHEPLRPLNRFFAVHPIEDCPYETLDGRMHPWPVHSSINQIEALSFTVLEPMFLAGLTLAGPIGKCRFKITFARLVEGPDTFGSTYWNLIPPNTVIDPKQRPVIEYLFPKLVQVKPCCQYTLTLQLKAMDEESSILFFKGNILTSPSVQEAQEILNDGFQTMIITTANKAPEETVYQIEAGGPILGFFYQSTN